MKSLFNEEEFNKAKSKDKLPCECYYCSKVFFPTKKEIQQVNNPKSNTNLKYCSIKCCGKGNTKTILVNCKECSKEFLKFPNQIKKTKNHFCSRNCSGRYNALHKTHGTRRSKLEVWLESKLPTLYPNLEFHFNRKDTINSELDIYIPTLKLAFELNGIFHYEAIYGEDKLSQIRNNDNRKFQACGETGISLCIIDTSSQKYFKESNSLKYLDIIKNIIDNQLLTIYF